MKRMVLGTGIILILCQIITGVILPGKAAAGEPSGQGGKAEAEFGTERSTVWEDPYYLGIYEGFVGAFCMGQEKPIYVSNRKVKDLPERDREALTRGIGANSRQELKTLIEDYCS